MPCNTPQNCLSLTANTILTASNLAGPLDSSTQLVVPSSDSTPHITDIQSNTPQNCLSLTANTILTANLLLQYPQNVVSHDNIG